MIIQWIWFMKDHFPGYEALFLKFYPKKINPNVTKTIVSRRVRSITYLYLYVILNF